MQRDLGRFVGSEGGSIAGWFRKFAASDALKDMPDDIPLVKRPYDWKLGAHTE